MNPLKKLLSRSALALPILGGSLRAAAAVPMHEGGEIVSKHQVVFTKPPARIPSNQGSDAPLLGNGDFLAALGGTADKLSFHLSKADLWELRPNGSPRALARLDIGFSGMEGADYQVTQNLLRATTTGVFKKGAATLTVESAVAATENLLWVRLSAAGAEIAGNAGLHRQDQQGIPSSVADNDSPVNIGREMYGGGRYYFDGEIADVTVRKEPISEPLTNKPLKPGKFDGRTASRELPVPKMDRSVSVGAWIRINRAGEANYIFSKGEWNKAYSLGLTGGCLRWSVNGVYIQTDKALETGKWLYVAGSFDGRSMRIFIDGKQAAGETNDAADGIQVVERRFDEGVNGVLRSTGAACALHIPGWKGGGFTVSSGKPVILIVAASGLANTKDYRADAVRRATETSAASLSELSKAHVQWWREFWGKSFVEISDKRLEQRYYLSHYAIACASRLPHFPPGLYGWTLSGGTPMWGGAYFNNYNFFSTFYGLYAANHIEQAMPCNDAVIDAIELGRDCARDEAKYDTMCANSEKLRMREGILLPVSMLPYGIVGAPTTWGQRSNASYACVPLASTWYAIYDLEFAKRAYPFVRETANFWEQFLVFENGRYVDRNDAVHENSGRDTNPIHTLALIKLVMNLAIDMSAALNVDANKHDPWREIRDRLSDYPQCTVGELPKGTATALPDTAETKALPIFRLSDKGYAWHNSGNTVVIQHIFPGNGIGLGVRPELLERARNTIRASGRWIDMNGCNSFYPAAVRVGYDPGEILRHLSHWVETSNANGMRMDNPHGVELFSVVPCTLQEMLLQSYDGTLRFFPNWPQDRGARFGTLRARGAFLVSADLKNGVVSGVKITSEKGRDCTIVNPWPGVKVVVMRNGRSAEKLSGARITLKTSPNEILEISPL